LTAPYDGSKYPKPSLTVDLAIFTVVDSALKTLLIQRKNEPYKDRWALPGGFVDVGDAYQDQGESLEEAAYRELQEETGLPRGPFFLEQLYTFGAPYRDPRMRIVSVAYYALIRPDFAQLAVAGSDAHAVEWVPVADVTRLAFDHDEILKMAVERLRGRVDCAPLVFELVPPVFTVAELRSAYEAIKGVHYDPANFRRLFRRFQEHGLVENAPGKRQTGTRPARVYRHTGRAEPHAMGLRRGCDLDNIGELLAKTEGEDSP
jgi:8-oxo-dGTP diphosphatase